MTEHSFPLPKQIIVDHCEKLHLLPESASIREINRLISMIEKQTNLRYIRMEFGIPGLPVDEIAIDAEVDALRNKHVAGVYAPFDGIPPLKEAASDFIKAFLNLEIPPECCIPTNGSMQGGFIAMAVTCRRHREKDHLLFLDPGFPVNKLQASFLGLAQDSIDIYNCREQKLLDEIEKKLQTGTIGAVMWSNPNNPTWLCFTEAELEGIGKLMTAYDAIAIEDLAYFCMDFRKDYGVPYQEPYQPTIGHYTSNFITLISSSKVFSYAGQRVAIAAISPALMNKVEPDLQPWFRTNRIGHAFIHGGMYATTAGVAESPQYGLTALMRASCEGRLNMLESVREYARRAAFMKEAFTRHGFLIVYDNDLGKSVADGFYFTISYPGFQGVELLMELIRYGISAITLEVTGSIRTEGLRACVSLTDSSQYDELEKRLFLFKHDHPV